MRRRRGFTLVEVLASTALFAVLGVLLFQVLQSAMSVWTTGERNRELLDRAHTALQLVGQDLRHAWPGVPGATEQDARFECGWWESDAGLRVPVLRFTRLCREARFLPWLRRAGDRAGAQGVATLAGGRDPLQMQPTGGLAESLYTTARLPGRSLPALLRRFRSPIGGAGSLLDPQLIHQPDRLLEDGTVIAEGVLHFGLQFWGPQTQGWDEIEAPPLEAWDSTRALLPPQDLSFPLGVGPDSLDDGSDDVFPGLVRIELVLDARGETAILVDPVSSEAGRLRLSSVSLLQAEGAPEELWVEGEWVRVVSVQGPEVTVRRGVRGTRPAAHAAGVRARVGRYFERIVRIPTGRENFNP